MSLSKSPDPTPVDVYLDVDGVLNAVTMGRPDWGWKSLQRVEANGYLIAYSPEMIERFNQLAAKPHVTFYWLTTWLHDAPEMLAPKIGLEGQEWAVLEDPREYVESMDWWKLLAIQAQAEKNPTHRVLWVDDDIAYEKSAVRWVTTGDPKRLRSVSPVTSIGLTERSMKNIERWIDG